MLGHASAKVQDGGYHPLSYPSPLLPPPQVGDAQLHASRAILALVVPSASDLIKSVREKVEAGGLAAAEANGASGEDIEVLQLLGQGTVSGRRGTWATSWEDIKVQLNQLKPTETN